MPMDGKYLPYDSIAFAEDPQFIQWVKNHKDSSLWEAWLQAHPDKRAVVEEAKELVRALTIAGPTLSSERVDSLWDKIDQATEEAVVKPLRPRRNWGRIVGFAASAAAVIALLIYLTGEPASSPQMFETPWGEQYTQLLPDQSAVRLNADSRIRYDAHSWQQERVIQLEGEAFFSVEKGNRFQVQTENGTVEVLGTQFNVNTRNGLEVECLEGKVRVNAENGNSVVLEALEGARITPNASTWETYETTSEKIASWQQGMFMYEGTALRNVFDEFERQFGIKVELEASIGERKYFGFFSSNNRDSALYSICWPMQLEAEIEADKIVVRQK